MKYEHEHETRVTNWTRIVLTKPDIKSNKSKTVERMASRLTEQKIQKMKRVGDGSVAL